jgi:hypothetical protein
MRARAWHCPTCHYLKQSSTPSEAGRCPMCQTRLHEGVPDGRYVPMQPLDEARYFDRLMRTAPER